MKSDAEREKFLVDCWQIDYPDGAAIKKQIQKLELPREPGSYRVILAEREKT
jgi:valyl-tRNA synthetase